MPKIDIATFTPSALPENPQFHDITGQVFHLLTVIAYAGKRRPDGPNLWLCKCACGSDVTAPISGLRSGRHKSCGCYRATIAGDRQRKHGATFSPEWYSWNKMKQRCSDPANNDYQWYGARGISVCPEWLHDFAQFLSDMGKKPTPAHSIDRIDTNGNYSPENCKWSTPTEQQRNRRSSRYVPLDGRMVALSEYCEVKGVPYQRTIKRIWKGWSLEDAVHLTEQEMRARTNRWCNHQKKSKNKKGER